MQDYSRVVNVKFEELGWQLTPMGELSLRRRFDLSVRTDLAIDWTPIPTPACGRPA